jgi:enoyl-[acyl-carrier protein] reductase I
MLNYQRRNAPMRRNVTHEEVGNSTLYLLSDLSKGVTGEIHYVDAGYNIMSMPALDELKAQERRAEIAGEVEPASA